MKLSTLTQQQTSYTITAVIDSALGIGAGGSSGSLVDKSVVRNASGQLIVPGSHLKGRLRHECEKIARGLGWAVRWPHTVNRSLQPRSTLGTYKTPLAETNPHCIISEIFGDASQPSRLIVDDLVCEIAAADLPSEVIRTGVTINRRRRTAEDRRLYFLETSPSNLQIPFTGEIHLLDPPTYATALICAGLKHIHALGGSKSAGLGWLTWQWSEIPIHPQAWVELGRVTL